MMSCVLCRSEYVGGACGMPCVLGMRGLGVVVVCVCVCVRL